MGDYGDGLSHVGTMIGGPTGNEPNCPDRDVAIVEESVRLRRVERYRVPRGQIVPLKTNLNTQRP